MTKRKKNAEPDSHNAALLPLESLAIKEAQDFDSEAMAAACSEAQDLAKQALAVLSQLRKTCEEIRRDGVPTALTKSDLSPRLKQTIEQAQQVVPKLPAILIELAALTERWRTSESRTRRTRFEQIAKQLNWKIVGSWPEPVVEQVVFIVVNESTGRATVNGQQMKGTATAERIASAVTLELENLQKNRTDPVEFIASVRKAFTAVGGSAETGLSVLDLLHEMLWQRQSKAFQRDPRPELFRGYSVSQFRNDLTYYLASGAPRVKEANTEYELEIQGGSFASDGIFMYFPQTDRLATCGRLTFRPLGGEERR